MNEVLIILLIVLNNILWMAFVYIFTPQAQKEKINLPKIKLPDFHKEEEEDKDLVDVEEAPSAKSVLESMGVKSYSEGEHNAS